MRRDPRSEVPDIGNGFWERVEQSVREMQQAEATLWNGRLDFIPNSEYRPGSDTDWGWAHWNGTISLSRRRVEHLQRMFELGPIAVRYPPAAASCWLSIAATGHEFRHLTASSDWTVADRLRDLLRPDLESIEEAFTSAAAHEMNPELIDLTVPKEIARVLHRVERDRPDLLYPAHPGWAQAALGFANDFYAETGVPVSEVLRIADREPDSRKAPALADLMYRESELPQVVHNEQEAENLRATLGGVIDLGFAGLGVSTDLSLRPRVQGVEISSVVNGVARDAAGRYLRNDPTVASAFAGLARAADAMRMPHAEPGGACRRRPDPDQRGLVQ